MKGLIFTELLAMADEAVGEDRVDHVISGCPLSGGGAYSAVGNYPSSDLIALVQGFSGETGLSVEALQKAFGHWMPSDAHRHRIMIPSNPGRDSIIRRH